MSYRKDYNRSSIWKEYVAEKSHKLTDIALPKSIFLKEIKFKEFMTYGTYKEKPEEIYDFDTIPDNEFWKLFDFSTNYFEMDMIDFDKFEQSRLKRRA